MSSIVPVFPFRVVNGLLGLDKTPAISLTDEVTHERPEAVRAWREIEGWARAASVRRTLRQSRFGFLGNTYSGMLDMYSDFTMIQAQTGLHLEVLEMSDLARLLRRCDAPGDRGQACRSARYVRDQWRLAIRPDRPQADR